MPEQTAPWVQPVRQRLRAWRAGQLLLDTCRAHLYFPDERHPRWAVPAGDLLGPAPGAFTHDGLAVLSPGDADTWVEEDRQTYGQPRNPYHRVDALPSSRHVQILAGQTIVAETSRPVLLIETGVVPRWYIPPGDVAWARLEPVPARTTCQYKGEASYFRVRDSDAELWTYRHPDPEAAAIAGHVAAAGQPGLQIIVDGIPEGQP
ncbi:MAG TPA: DUF427 domain-containing protein [Streptosporangiaceae bacterium]|nr:DUF427 domain-containing protein [Streptosporangiaceae bacterium]